MYIIFYGYGVIRYVRNELGTENRWEWIRDNDYSDERKGETGKEESICQGKKKEKRNGEMSIEHVYSPISSTDFAFGK